MTATNKSPWIGNLDGADHPLIMPGQVQAGSTQEIKRGEICVFDETSGYFVPLDAVADVYYSLAISYEEQQSDDAARYMDFIMAREMDVFQLPLSEAAQIALGDALIPVASNSQQVAQDVDGATAFALSVGDDNYPQAGTDLASKSYAQFCINPQFSYLYQYVLRRQLRKIVVIGANYTVLPGDLGAVITNKGDGGTITVTAPNATVPRGFWFDLAVMADQAVRFDPKPDTAKVYIKGAAQTAGKYVSMTDIGDYARFMWDGTDWLAIFSISGADDDITVES